MKKILGLLLLVLVCGTCYGEELNWYLSQPTLTLNFDLNFEDGTNGFDKVEIFYLGTDNRAYKDPGAMYDYAFKWNYNLYYKLHMNGYDKISNRLFEDETDLLEAVLFQYYRDVLEEGVMFIVRMRRRERWTDVLVYWQKDNYYSKHLLYRGERVYTIKD